MELNSDSIKNIISPLFTIQSVTLGSKPQGFVVQFHGIPLLADSIKFHAEISKHSKRFIYPQFLSTMTTISNLPLFQTPLVLLNPNPH